MHCHDARADEKGLPRQDPADYEQRFRSKFGKDLNKTCKYKDGSKSGQDLLVGMMQDSFPQGPHHPFRFPDLYGIARMPTVSSTFIFLRRNLAMATLSSWRRFRQRLNFVGELHFTEAEAMLIEAYYTANCVHGMVGIGESSSSSTGGAHTPRLQALPPGLRACVVVDFEALCAGDAKALAALAVGFRVTIEQIHKVAPGTLLGPQACGGSGNAHNYTAPQLAVAKQFFKGRTSALFPHAGNEL